VAGWTQRVGRGHRRGAGPGAGGSGCWVTARWRAGRSASGAGTGRSGRGRGRAGQGKVAGWARRGCQLAGGWPAGWWLASPWQEQLMIVPVIGGRVSPRNRPDHLVGVAPHAKPPDHASNSRIPRIRRRAGPPTLAAPRASPAAWATGMKVPAGLVRCECPVGPRISGLRDIHRAGRGPGGRSGRRSADAPSGAEPLHPQQPYPQPWQPRRRADLRQARFLPVPYSDFGRRNEGFLDRMD
jgi:hypothetical protein